MRRNDSERAALSGKTASCCKGWNRRMGRGMIHALVTAMAFFSIGFFPAGALADDEARFEPYRIRTVSPGHVQMNLFDYWVKGEKAHDHPDKGDCTIEGCKGEFEVLEKNQTARREYYKMGINAGHALIFTPCSDGYAGLWNKWTGSEGAECRGIVANTLVDGYPVLNLEQNVVNSQPDFYTGGDTGRPANESLAYLFNPDPDEEHDG